MKSKLYIFSLVLLGGLFATGQIFATTGGIIGILSPRITYDGRPVLWQNLESDEPSMQVSFFQGPRYHFLGLVNAGDTSRVYAGLNTAGFGIVFAKAQVSASDSLYEQEALFLKEILGSCGTLRDFEEQLQASSLEFSESSSFACFDAIGGNALYEAGSERFEPFHPVHSPEGIRVRSNFIFSTSQYADWDFWRYHRARELLSTQLQAGSIHFTSMIKTIARDIATVNLNPYPLPYVDPDTETHTVDTRACINKYNTASCVVLHGVRDGEEPQFSTMWVVLGEPLCGVAVPLWPVTGKVPNECSGENPLLNKIIRDNQDVLYNDKQNPTFVNTRLVADPNRGLLPKLDNIENRIFVETEKALKQWKTTSSFMDRMTEFQNQMSSQTARDIRY